MDRPRVSPFYRCLCCLVYNRHNKTSRTLNSASRGFDFFVDSWLTLWQSSNHLLRRLFSAHAPTSSGRYAFPRRTGTNLRARGRCRHLTHISEDVLGGFRTHLEGAFRHLISIGRCVFGVFDGRELSFRALSLHRSKQRRFDCGKQQSGWWR